MTIQTALLSVSDKAGIVNFAKALAQRGVRLLSTGGTAKLLAQAGLKVTEVAQHTGSPEILDGRVKTLHPKIHGGLLARRDSAEHLQTLQEHGIDRIDLLVVNLYPFRAAVAKPDCTFADAVENIDIGGPAMLRAARLGTQPSAVIASSTRARASGLTRGLWLMTRETVCRETAAALATSSMVMPRPTGNGPLSLCRLRAPAHSLAATVCELMAM